MTVSYNADVQTSSFARFWRLLFRWRGSLLRLIWRDILLFASCYLAISLVYHLVLDCEWKACFYLVSRYCDQWIFQIPLTFVLGESKRVWQSLRFLKLDGFSVCLNVLKWSLLVTAGLKNDHFKSRRFRLDLMLKCDKHIFTKMVMLLHYVHDVQDKNKPRRDCLATWKGIHDNVH